MSGTGDWYRNGAAQQVVLSADDINALISKNEVFKGKVYITLADGDATAEVRVPVDGIPGVKGRFLNASLTAISCCTPRELMIIDPLSTGSRESMAQVAQPPQSHSLDALGEVLCFAPPLPIGSGSHNAIQTSIRSETLI
nr:hypothetical protein [uncultured bacterium]